MTTRLRDEALAHQYAVAGGMDKATELLQRSHGADADAILEQIMAASSAVPFQFLRGRRAEQIVTYLSSEHPQVIALVLAHLPMGTAAQVIEGLPAEMRADVAGRYAKLESTDPEVVAEVELAMLRRVGAGTPAEPTTSRGGVKPLAQLLNNVARDTEKVVLGELERTDPSLATAVRDLMFVFEDIAHLEDRGLQEVLRSSDTRTIALALKDANPAVQAKIEANLSQRAAEDVERVRIDAGHGPPLRRRGRAAGDRACRPQAGGGGPHRAGARWRRRRLPLMSRVIHARRTAPRAGRRAGPAGMGCDRAVRVRGRLRPWQRRGSTPTSRPCRCSCSARSNGASTSCTSRASG